MNSLRPFHSLSGIFVDDFIERSFAWELPAYYYGTNEHQLPYKEKWIGFLHNPPNVPGWFDVYNSPPAILGREVFQASLNSCVCLVTLSEYLKSWLEQRVNVPVISVLHPTETPTRKWSPIKFMSSSTPRVIQIGYWLRRMESILDLQVSYPYKKMWLPSDLSYMEEILGVYEKTRAKFWEEKYRWAGVSHTERFSNDDYDDLLSSGIVFLDLYDSSANNAVIESIARHTPILVNRVPAVVEYLGEDYPFYYSNLDEAAHLLSDRQNIFDAHEYLKDLDKEWLNGNYFAADLQRKLKGVLQ
jgi:hypothetical protein